ncbi:hypothetical protein HDV01_001586 [Terramyces sp. JEL0728]|nr:hypothetical protein HDV01_001586 [Terramyces sp. JEL0728]
MIVGEENSDSPPNYGSQSDSPGYSQVTTTQWFHIYREHIFDRNAYIKHKDKSETKFFVHFHYTAPKQYNIQVVVRPWIYEFHWIDKSGPIAMSIEPYLQKTKQFPDFIIKDNSSQTQFIIDRGSTFGRKYKFGLAGIEYCWRGVTLSANLELLRYPEKKVVAVYHRRNRFSFKKEGRMAVEPEVYDIVNMVICTGVAAEIWEYGDEDDLA